MLSKIRTVTNLMPRLQWRQASTGQRHLEYLHRSVLPSFHFQECLPRLPIPKLEDTMRRYVTSMEALEGHPEISPKVVESTKRAVYHFMKNDGPKLNELLIDRDLRNKHTSYISEPWFNMYLESRLPLPLNYNPFMVLNRDKNDSLNDQLVRATNTIVSSLRFYRTMKEEVLHPEVYYVKDTAKSPAFQRLVKYVPNTFNLRYIPMYLNGAYPLDMSQYGNLFCSSRIPQAEKDCFKTFPKSRHLLVIRNGSFYVFDGLDKNGAILPVDEIMSSLRQILNDKVARPEHEVGFLSSEDRDNWAAARNRLLASGNVSELNLIDSSIFCVVLEDEACDIEDVDKTTRMFLYGNGGSRWFDKSFSLIISKNGEAAINFEHAWGDGVAVVRYMNEMFEDSTNNPRVVSSDLPDVPVDVKRLEFKLDSANKADIENAKARYESDTGRLKMAAAKRDDMSKAYLKEKKISPDGVMQLAFQVAHRRMYGHPAATYESCSTAAFKHGRTETMRPCTVEAQAVAKEIAKGGLSDSKRLADLKELVRESCKKHNSLTFEAAMGLGFDRHMFGLRYVSEMEGGTTPNIFGDPVWKIMNHIILSTSTLDTNSIAVGGFAPVVPDGFGIGYGVRVDHLGCNITSYEGRDVVVFVDNVMESLSNIKTILEN